MTSISYYSWRNERKSYTCLADKTQEGQIKHNNYTKNGKRKKKKMRCRYCNKKLQFAKDSKDHFLTMEQAIANY